MRYSIDGINFDPATSEDQRLEINRRCLGCVFETEAALELYLTRVVSSVTGFVSTVEKNYGPSPKDPANELRTPPVLVELTRGTFTPATA